MYLYYWQSRLCFHFFACGKNTESDADYSRGREGYDNSGSAGNINESDALPSNEETSENTTHGSVKKVKVTVPEGYTLARIGMLLEEKGFCTDDEFIEAAQTYKSWLDTSKYPFLKDMQNTKNVCFYLEGYLFPATYDIPENSSARDIVRIMLDGTATYYNNNLMARVNSSGYNLRQILTIASIIEKEVKTDEQTARWFLR